MTVKNETNQATPSPPKTQQYQDKLQQDLIIY